MNKKIFLISILILIISFCYFNTLNNEFLDYDDDIYIVNNYLIKNLNYQNIKRIVFGYYFSGHYPLLLFSYAFEYLLWDLNPVGYHITNLLFFTFSNILIFFIILAIVAENQKKFFIASITSLLFATHPVHVESVTWLSERKDVLFAFFFLFSFYLFIKFHKTKKNRYFLFSFSTFIIACLSKSTAVVFPLLLLPYSYFFCKKDEMKKILTVSIPYFLVSLFFLFIAIKSGQSSGNIKAYPTDNFFINTLFALKIVGVYLYKLTLPFNLIPRYVFDVEKEFYQLDTIFFILLFCGFIAILLRNFRKNKYISFGIIWFLITLLPTSNIIPLSNLMGDRFMYLPSIGFFMLISATLVKYRKPFLYFLLSLLIISLSLLTVKQNGVWENSLTFWTYNLNHEPRNAIAHNNLGNYYFQREEFKNALNHYNLALKYNPDFSKAYLNLGLISLENGESQKAIGYFYEAIKRDPVCYEAYNNLGNVLLKDNKIDDAIIVYQKVLEIAPQNVGAYYNLGNAFARKGLYKKALDCFKIFAKYWSGDPRKIQQALTNIKKLEELI
ncbi:MAG: tetratricopeptide repeat protein [Thermodesulfobacteriota bacterium]|nr:tetratricopeptide repeat protein [Thermodesulfobacteriota bacterium]